MVRLSTLALVACLSTSSYAANIPRHTSSSASVQTSAHLSSVSAQASEKSSTKSEASSTQQSSSKSEASITRGSDQSSPKSGASTGFRGVAASSSSSKTAAISSSSKTPMTSSSSKTATAPSSRSAAISPSSKTATTSSSSETATTSSTPSTSKTATTSSSKSAMSSSSSNTPDVPTQMIPESPLSADDDSSDSPPSTDAPASSDTGGETTSETECFADDDTVYTADVCADVDAVACETYCADNFLCDHNCGSGAYSCEDGSGALCAMTKLSGITEICMGSTATPSSWSPHHTYMTALPSDDTTSSSGCDDHAYCNFCKGNATCEYIMFEVGPAVVDGYELIADIGFGPLALSLLSNLDKVCDFINATASDATAGITASDDTDAAGSKANKWTSTTIEASAAGALAVAAVFVVVRRRRQLGPTYEPIPQNDESI